MQRLTILIYLQIFIGCITLVHSEVVRCSFQIRKFDEYLNNPYTCVAMGVNYPNKIKVEEISGKQKGGRTNRDVKALDISNQHCEQFPSGFQKHFPNLEGLAIVNSKLRSVRRKDLENFPKLKSLSFAGNELKTLEFALFISNPQLKRISFAENQLIGVGSDLLDNLNELVLVDLSNAGCINSKASTKDDIKDLSLKLLEKCPATEDMKKVHETEVKHYFCLNQLENATAVQDECMINQITCSNDNKNKKEEIKSLQAQLDECGDEKTCKIRLSTLEKQAATDAETIKDLEEKFKTLETDYKELQKIYDREVLTLQACSADLENCKKTKNPLSDQKDCSRDYDRMKIIIECDKFYDTICISESTLIPFEGMTIGGMKLPNGTIINGSFITELYLSGGAIRAIPDNFGQYFSNLVKVVMNSVKVEEINKNSFAGCTHLTNITITNGKLTSIHRESFVDATNLAYVDFSNNLLTEIGEAIQSLNKLQTLILSSNQISTVEWKYFKSMTKIEIITISNNPLQYVDSGFLSTEVFTSLTTVDMSGSKCIDLKYPVSNVDVIKQALYSGCPFKVQLQCDFKQFGKDYVCEAKETFIYYENTLISSIIGTHTVEQNTLLDVTKIVINNQVMQYIPSNLFKEFSEKVIKVEIDNSGLVQINHLYGLKEVTIINNYIKVIDEYSFSGSPDVEVIILQGNKIERIRDGTFIKNHVVQSFDISNNNIVEFTSASIATILASSNIVTLSGNNLTSVVWTYSGPVRGQIVAENNPCLDSKSGKDVEAFVAQILDKCSEKYELECEFKYINEDYVCVSKNLNITAENTKITRVHGSHTESGLSSMNVIKLIITNQHMEYFPINIADVFPGLQKIEVTSSSLKKISKFVGQNLVWVKITGNQVSKVEENSFSGSILLNYIDISNNGITEIPKGIFESNTEITEVNLSHNRLENIKWSIFSIMTSLQTINISYNKLKQIDWSQLTVDVENIDLTGNECINMKYSVEKKDKFIEAINNECGTETMLTCSFKKSGSDYICYAINLEILNENTRITGVEGSHLSGKSDKDVTRLISVNQNVVYFPINIRKFFTTLKIVDIISKSFKLRVIFVSDDKFSITSQ